MSIHGEIINEIERDCDCGEHLELQVIKSARRKGLCFLGFKCEECELQSRESGYYREEDAREALSEQRKFHRAEGGGILLGH